MFSNSCKLFFLFIFVSLLWNCSKATDPNNVDDSIEFMLNAPDRVTNSYIALNWSKYQGDNFKEYVVNRKLKGYTDLKHSDLISVSDNIDDTTYIDFGLYSDKKYTYSIQVVTDTDSIVVSNTRNIKTKKSALDCNYEKTFDVQLVSSFKNFDKDIKGIHYHDSMYWVLLFEEKGGYYDTNEVEIVKYDFDNDLIMQTINIPDTYLTPTGLVYDGKNLWVSFSNNANGNKLYKIDIENKQVDKIFNVPQNVIDMTYNDKQIYLCSINNSIIRFDTVKENFLYDFRFGQNETNSTGILVSDSLIWIAYNEGKLLGLYNESGLQVGYAQVNDFGDWNDLPKLSIVEDKLIIIENGVAKLMAVHEF
jgi:hypothetical protein